MARLRPLTHVEVDAGHAEADALTLKVVDQVLADTANHLRGDVITENDLTILTRFWNDRVPELLDLVEAGFRRGAAHARAELRAALARLRTGQTAGAAAPLPEPDDDLPVDAAVLAVTSDFHVMPIPNEAADQLLANAKNRLVRTGNDVWEATRQQLHEGMLAGEGTLKLRERVMAAGPFAAPRALTIARSEVGHAMNQGSIGQMRQIDLPMTKEWLAVHDARTRPEHAEVDGERVDLNATFSIGFDPGDDYNCFTGDVPVEYARLDGATRRWYEGDVLRVGFASGSELTVTPNHPILRADGRWVAAQLLQPGDHGVRGRLVGQTSGQPDVEHVPAGIREVYDAAELGGHAKRVHGAPPDFHGDGRDGEVDVVVRDVELWRDRQPASDEEVVKFGLAAAELAVRAGPGSRRAEKLPPVERSSDGLVGSERVAATLVHAASGGQQPVGLATSAERDPRRDQPGVDAPAGDRVAVTEGGDGLTLTVTLDEVVDVQVLAFGGHVYNLDSGLGWYLADSIVAGNCRCTTGFDVPDDAGLVDAVTGGPDEGAAAVATGDDALAAVPARRSELAGDQLSAVRDYVGTGYDWTNYYLRENKGDLGKVAETRRAQIQAMDAAMQPTTGHLVSYRGITEPREAFGKAWSATDDLAGMEFTDHAYLSTSTTEDLGASFAEHHGGVLLKVDVPPGTPAIANDTGGESEIILGRGQHLRVTRDDGWVQVENSARSQTRVRRLHVEIVRGAS